MEDGNPAAPPPRIGRYELRRELGRGMMGVVYEAHDPALRRTIALKTIELAFAVSAEERQSFEQRFFVEARVAARLSHPGIVVVHDVGRDAESGLLFIALEYLPGRTLAEVIRGGTPTEWREALRITAAVAQALHHAHAKGVVHRDIKPANIMLLPTGQPKILDFGIAKIETARLQVTSAGQFFGTPLYMSPEQALGTTVGPASDLFSLGSVAYALITGRAAFAADSILTMVGRVIHQDPPPPSSIVAGLPEAVDYVLEHALAKELPARYPDGKTLAEDIEDVRAGRPPRHRGRWEGSRGHGTVVSRRPLPSTERDQLCGPSPEAESPIEALRAGPARSRFPRWSLLLAVAAALGLAVTLGTWFQARRDLPPPGNSSGRPPAPPVAEAPDPGFPKRVEEPTPTAAEVGVAPSLPVSGKLAQLFIDFEHPLKSGTMRLWLDGDLLLEQPLDSRVTQNIAGLKLRKGSMGKVFAVSPGRHEVKVQVAWDENLKSEAISGLFRAGSGRHLEIRVGRLLKNLSVEWR